MYFEDVSKLLVPLEGVDSAGDSRSKAVFDVVVNPQVCLDHVHELVHNLVAVFVQQSLQLAHVFKLIEVLFKLGVKLHEDIHVLLQNLNDLLAAHLAHVACGLLQLRILCAQPLVEVRHLGFIVLFEESLLLVNDFVKFVQELDFMFTDHLFRFEEDMAHLLGQVRQISLALSNSFTHVLVDVSKVPVVVLQSDETVVNHLFFHGVQVFLGVAEQLLEFIGLLFAFFGILVLLFLHLFQVLWNAFFAHGFVADVNDWFWEVFYANAAIHLVLEQVGSTAWKEGICVCIGLIHGHEA